jgi:hypothetical protein
MTALAALDPRISGAALPGGFTPGLWQSTGDASPREDVYSIHHLSAYELQQMYQHVLEDACAYAKDTWKIAKFDPAAGYWGDGISDGNGGTRTVVSMLLACATLLKYENGLAAGQRRDLLDKFIAAVRYTTATHRTGTQKCTDGKQWGATPDFGPGSWQSGMWTGTLAWGAWLVWETLDAELQIHLQRVVAWECDILSHRPPPNRLWLDTKAEENGWEVPCLVLSTLMFPSHPHALAWQETALKYMMNTLCTEADTRSTAVVDGRPVEQWVKAANLQPDFTLENHNRFHPSYVGCSSYFLTQAVMYYTYASRPVPQAATHHLFDTWRTFQTILLPWGESAYPQGMDWELHGLPFINLYASFATHWQDPLAAHLEQCSLQYLRAWQTMGGGSLALPGSPFGITRHAINAEQISYGLLAHSIFGPPVPELTGRAAAAQERGVRDYPYVDFIVHRTMNKFASFSWKNKIMGLLIPIRTGHEGNPDFTVPIPNGFVGSFEIEPAAGKKTNDAITVVEHSRRQTSDGFETSGTLLLNGGRLQQTLKVTSVGGQTVVYEDRVTAIDAVTVTSERGIPIGIENDEITGGRRVVTSQQDQVVFDWKRTQSPKKLTGPWINIDSRLGAVVLGGHGVTYAQASEYSRGISVYTDILYGSFDDQARQHKAGEEVAHRLAIFYVEVTPEETRALARSCRIQVKPGKRALLFQQPGGRHTEIPLLSARI